MNFNRDLFSQCVRNKLKQDGISHPQAAKQIGVSKCSVYLMTKDDITCLPGLYMFYNTCAWLGRTPNDFFITQKDENE